MTLAPSPEAIELRQPADEGNARNLQDYLRILWRYRWGIIVLGLIGALIAALKAYTDTPIYQAQSLMLIERQGARFVPIDPVYQQQAHMFYDFGEYYQTQYQILTSRPIAERVVEKLGLDAFDARSPGKPPLFSWQRWFGSAETVPAAKPAPDVRRERAVNRVQGSVQIKPIQNSQLVRVVFRGSDPKLAAQLADTLPIAYIEEALDGRLAMTETASSWLTERLATLRKKLEDSEKALQDFRDRGGLIDIRGVDSLASQEVEMASQRLAAARRERVDKQALYNQVQEARRAGAGLDTIPALIAYPLVGELKTATVAAERSVRELSQRYGPKHPRMIEAQSKLDTARGALDRQLAAAADSVIKDYEVARQREAQVGGELGMAKGEIRDINRKQYELQRLQREVDANRQLYEQFQTRFKETSASGGVQSANARLIESAHVPGAPVYPNKGQAISIGLALGLALGIALAFLLDHLDNTLKGADDVERRLGVPVLGLLPRLETKGSADRSPLRHFADSPKSSFSEAVRTIRTGVLLSAIDHPHRRLLITSSVPGEGKTTLSVNLAHALGQMRKVLLIDADMRRPAVHRSFEDIGDGKGLSHFVAGEAAISECVRPIGDSNVYVMPAGPVPPNPQEMLSSQRLADAIEALSKSFDHVIIDCAPACAVSDALILSRLAHAVIYVVRSDSTPWQLADEGLRRLRRVSAPIIGAVVNQVIPRRTRGYYGYGKYYYHGDGYYSDYGYAKAR
jgi:capsular exopolysaccharide synthesis family protein